MTISDPWRIASRAALVLSLLGWTAAADAEPRSPRELARGLLREGNRHFEAKRYESALEKYRRARELFPSYKLHYNLATTLEALGRPAPAASHYELYLLEARGRELPATVASVEARLQAIAERLARLRVSCAIGDAEVLVDGVAVGRVPLPHPVYLAPGAHRLTVRKGERTLYQRDLSLVAGEHQLTIVPDEHNARVEAGQRTAPARSIPTPVPLVPQEPPSRPRFYKRAWFWIVVSAVVAGAVTAVVATQTGGSDRMPTGLAGTIR